jgi:hypothetical protein
MLKRRPGRTAVRKSKRNLNNKLAPGIPEVIGAFTYYKGHSDTGLVQNIGRYGKALRKFNGSLVDKIDHLIGLMLTYVLFEDFYNYRPLLIVQGKSTVDGAFGIGG